MGADQLEVAMPRQQKKHVFRRHQPIISSIGARVLASVVAFATLTLLYAPVGHASVRQIPGTRVTLDLPDGYELITSTKSGFKNRQLNLEFLVGLELPGPALNAMIARFSSKVGLKSLKTKSFTNLEHGVLNRGDKYLYIRGFNPAKGGLAVYWLMFGVPDHTVQLYATLPQARLDSGEIDRADIERVFASARIVNKRLELRKPFRLGYVGPFTLSPVRTAVRDQQIFMLGNAATLEPTRQRTILQVLPIPVPDKAKARAMKQLTAKFATASRLQNVQISERHPVEIAGLTGVEIVGHGTDKNSVDLGLYQVVLGGRNVVYTIYAQAPRAEMNRYLVEFRKMANSFSLTGR